MTPREKKLAAITGVLVLLLLGYFIWTEVGAAYTFRQNRIADLDGQIADKELRIEKGRRAGHRLAVYEQRSLPADRELARSLYQDWLLNLVEDAQLQEANVVALAEYAQDNTFHRLTFNVSGIGRLDQVTRLIYRFYEHDHLHLVRRLQIVPIKDSRNLDVSLSVEAVALSESENTERLTAVRNPCLGGKSLEYYDQEIIGRNIFAPPNHPPRLASVGSKQVEVRRTLSFTAKATDADPLDTVTYALGDEAPADARIDNRSGQFSWTPRTIGTFQFELIAQDDGMPAAEARQTVRVSVNEPPKPVVAKTPDKPRRLEFDVAKHTYLIGTIERSGRREVWLQNRTSGEIHKLKIGDSVRFGSVDGTVERIGQQDAEIVVGDKRLLVSVGKNLFESKELPNSGT